jgi:hypothetical protein
MIYLMRDLEPGLGVLWDGGRVSAMIYLVGKWLLARAEIAWCWALDGVDFSASAGFTDSQ